MAHPNEKLISAIRKTAEKLENGTKYEWGHMGSCNCGNLAQELTQLTKAEIHKYAMEGRGDWREQLEQYCPTSGMQVDLIIADMLNYGLTTSDLQHLEWLSDPEVLKRIPLETRDKLKHNVRADVVLYLYEWAYLLEDKLLKEITLDLTFLENKKEIVLV